MQLAGWLSAPQLVGIKVSGGHLVPVIVRAGGRGRRAVAGEVAYLKSQPLARIATVGHGRPGLRVMSRFLIRAEFCDMHRGARSG